MAEVIELDHIRRARRLFGILLVRMGLESFLASGERARVDRGRFEEAVALCVGWSERRTGRRIEEATQQVLRRQLNRLLLRQIAEGLLRAGY